MIDNNQQIRFDEIDKKLEPYALDAPDKSVRFRITNRMLTLKKGTMPFREQDAVNENMRLCIQSAFRYIKAKNYRMLFALMNFYGFDTLHFSMTGNIPVLDKIRIFPQGCFCSDNSLSEDVLIHAWMYSSLDDLMKSILESVRYFKINTSIKFISEMHDLKYQPAEVIKGIIKTNIYQDVVMYNSFDQNRYLPQKDIRKELIIIINQLLKILDPYLNFYTENNQLLRIAFLPWSLPESNASNFIETDENLGPFRAGVFDFGKIPLWTKTTHSKYPVKFRNQAKTILLMKHRKGTIFNALFHKDLLPILFQYMAFNSLIIEKEETIQKYRTTISKPHNGVDEEKLYLNNNHRQRF